MQPRRDGIVSWPRCKSYRLQRNKNVGESRSTPCEMHARFHFFVTLISSYNAEAACHEGCARTLGIQLIHKQSLASRARILMYNALIVR